MLGMLYFALVSNSSKQSVKLIPVECSKKRDTLGTRNPTVQGPLKPDMKITGLKIKHREQWKNLPVWFLKFNVIRVCEAIVSRLKLSHHRGECLVYIYLESRVTSRSDCRGVLRSVIGHY